MLNNKSILITGGTGSFGKAFTRYILEKYPSIKKIVPIAPSYRILDVAKAIAPEAEHHIVGTRQGEKLDEIMTTASESPQVAKRDGYYIICPEQGQWSRDEYCEKTGAVAVEDGFEYDSGSNDVWLSVEEIRKLISDEDMMGLV